MSTFDVVIRGGTVIDGSGAPGERADIAVKDGVIAEVGTVSGNGEREIDADGSIVAPGFVDVHTHYDGQSTWDSYLQPSSWHGVTTVVMGNCGVGFAPVVPEDHDRLVKLMEGVEDIPGVALAEGLSWEWESFGEYLDTVERRPHDLDIGTQIPHAALRTRVMRERAAAHEEATGPEIETMARMAAEAIEAGALGFSTSRTLNHKTRAGELTPSYGAGGDELEAIARAIGSTGKGVLQLVTDWDDVDVDFELIRRMVKAAGRPMSFSLGQKITTGANGAPAHGWSQNGLYKKILQRTEEINDEGHYVRAQVSARGIGVLLGLQCTLHPFSANPGWQKLAGLPVAEQARRMRDPRVRSEILSHGVIPARSLVGGSFLDRFELMFELTDPPNYEPDPSQSVARIAAAQGRTPAEVVYDLLLIDNGKGMLYHPVTNFIDGSLDCVHEMLQNPYTIPGLSDGGAHVGTVCDGSFPTTLMMHWARDRSRGRLPLEFVISQQARATAELVGLYDRGLVRPGYKADLNVIDFDELSLSRPEVHFDLPAGGRRLLQRADGYRMTMVSGTVTYENGESTGALPGRLVRGGRSAPRS